MKKKKKVKATLKSLNALASAICKIEGKKKEVSVGNVREVLVCMVQTMEDKPELVYNFLADVKNRAEKLA